MGRPVFSQNSINALLARIEALEATSSGVDSVFSRTGVVTAQAGDYTSAQVTESGNLYFTDTRADNRISAARGSTIQAWDADLDTWATKSAPTGAVVGTTDTQTLSGKTFTTPTIGSFTNAAHTHQDAAGGGTLDEAAIGGSAWTAFTPTLTGFASTTTNVARYKKIGRTCTVVFSIFGVSNATTFSLSNLPFAAHNTAGMTYGAVLEFTRDNSVNLASPGKSFIDPATSATTLNFYRDMAGTAWTNVLNKAARGTLLYETTT